MTDEEKKQHKRTVWEAWYAKNKERLKESCKEYRIKNRDKRIAVTKAWDQAHPERKQEINDRHRLKKQYGITPEKRQEMIDSQSGCCAICNNQFKSRTDTCIDHDHKTGKVRDMLCRNCNSMIGRCFESIEILSSAIKYLNKHTPKNEMLDSL